MLITENALAYSMMEMFRANNKVTDSLDIRLFKDWVKEARAFILKQRLDTNNGINESWVQDLEDVEMEQVDSSIYTSIPSGRYMLRSVKDIPFTIGRKNSIGTFVGLDQQIDWILSIMLLVMIEHYSQEMVGLIIMMYTHS